MLDYREFLDNTEKKKVLMSALNKKKERIDRFFEVQSDDTIIPVLEELVEVINDFVEKNLPPDIEV